MRHKNIMKNYPQWDRMDDFLKQHRNPHQPQPPKWGRRGLLAGAAVVILVLIIIGITGHHTSSSATKVQNTQSIPEMIPPSVQPTRAPEPTTPTGSSSTESNSTVTIALPSPATA